MASSRAAFFLLSFLALIAFVSASVEASSAEASEEVLLVGESLTSDVLVLDVSNFTDTVEQYDFIVVEFYAPWCGHCKNLAPEYEKAATALKSHDPPIILAKVDANEEANKPLAAEFGVKGFPTLTIIRNKGNVIHDFKGPREADGIISYLKKLSGPPSIELTSAEQAEEFLSENEKALAIIGVFKALDGEEYTNFIKVADVHRSSYVFAHTVDASYVPDNGVPLKTPSIRLHKDFDDKIADFSDFSSEEALIKFIDAESIPLVTEMTQKPEHRPALMKFFESTKDKVFLFLGDPEGKEEAEASEGKEEAEAEKESAALLSTYAKDAKSFKEKGLIFLISGKADSSNALQFFGLAASDLPAAVIQSEKGKKYIARNINSEQLTPWIEDYLGGNLKEHTKSDPIPVTNDEPVKVIVAKSIKETVLDAGKDVFLEFYAPWCGHCKKLAPVLDEVALSFESDPDVVIAKFDATTNDVPADLFDVKGFPTLYLYSAAGKVIPFDGDRTKEGIIEFINENRSSTVVKSDPVEDPIEEAITIDFSKDEL